MLPLTVVITLRVDHSHHHSCGKFRSKLNVTLVSSFGFLPFRRTCYKLENLLVKSKTALSFRQISSVVEIPFPAQSLKVWSLISVFPRSGLNCLSGALRCTSAPGSFLYSFLMSIISFVFSSCVFPSVFSSVHFFLSFYLTFCPLLYPSFLSFYEYLPWSHGELNILDDKVLSYSESADLRQGFSLPVSFLKKG